MLKDIFLDTLLLSEEAKLFGLARAVQETSHFIKSNLDLFIDIVCMMSCYIYCYSKNRQFKMQLFQRRKMYAGAIVVFTTIAIASRFFLYIFLDYIVDKKACQMGLDCSEGSQEFYEKLIVRNKFLRNLIYDGQKFIDQDGNYLKQTIYVPFTDYYFHINYIGLKLTDRKENCKNELNKLIEKLEADSKKSKIKDKKD